MARRFIEDVCLGLAILTFFILDFALLIGSPLAAIAINKTWPLYGLIPGALLLVWALGYSTRRN